MPPKPEIRNPKVERNLKLEIRTTPRFAVFFGFRTSSRRAGAPSQRVGFRISGFGLREGRREGELPGLSQAIRWALPVMIFAALVGNAPAQFTRPEGNSARSLSLQFIV